MTRRERRKRERKGFAKLILTEEEKDRRLIEEITKKIEDAQVFQEEQIRKGIEPKPITASTDWEVF